MGFQGFWGFFSGSSANITRSVNEEMKDSESASNAAGGEESEKNSVEKKKKTSHRASKVRVCNHGN